MRDWIVSWVFNWAIAYIGRWLSQNTPTQSLRDPRPAPIVRVRRKYSPVQTAPGTWNRAEGRWNT